MLDLQGDPLAFPLSLRQRAAPSGPVDTGAPFTEATP